MTKKAETYSMLMEQCRSYVAEAKPLVNEPNIVNSVMAPLMNGQLQEHFYVILLNTKNKMIDAPILVHKGTLNSCPVTPSDVFRPAITKGARSVILLHNHPSGDPTPSSDDVALTSRLMHAGTLIGINIMDHVIIGTATPTSPGYCSLREKGLVSFGG